MYRNLSRISPSVSVSFADFVRGLEATGRNIVKMQTGDPDFPTHPAVVSAAHDALLAGGTKYCDSRGCRACASRRGEAPQQEWNLG